jgi:hypothetical protein
MEYLSLQYASEDDKRDYFFVIDAVRDDGLNLQFASQELRDCIYVVNDAVRQNSDAIQYASERMQRDSADVMRLLRRAPGIYYCLPLEIREDRNVALIAVETNPNNLEFAGVMTDDKDVVWKAIRYNVETLRFASERLRNDEEMARAAISFDWRAVRHLSVELRDNLELMRLVLTKSAYAFMHAGSSVQANKVLAMLAITSWQNAYNYAAEELKCDPDIFERAASSLHFTDAVEELQTKDFAISCLKRGQCIATYLSVELLLDRDIFEMCIRHSKLANPGDEDDETRETIGNPLWYYQWKVPHVIEQYMTKELAIVAVKRNNKMLQHFPLALQKDPDVALAAVKYHASVFQSLKVKSPEIYMELLRQQPSAIETIRIPSNMARAMLVEYKVAEDSERALIAFLLCVRPISVVSEGAKVSRVDDSGIRMLNRHGRVFAVCFMKRILGFAGFSLNKYTGREILEANPQVIYDEYEVVSVESEDEEV